MDYKETLILPQTRFPMRGNLPQNEPRRYALWQEKDVYRKMKDLRQESTKYFNLHDGPPYANGELHIGHHSFLLVMAGKQVQEKRVLNKFPALTAPPIHFQ